MPTVIFDADSTIFTIETLDELSVPILKNFPDKLAKIRALTNKGMSGEIGFTESLEQRLEILDLNKNDIAPFAKSLTKYITPGLKELVLYLKNNNIDLWVLSGGLSEIIMPALVDLGFDKNKIHGSGVVFDENGKYLSLASADLYPCNQSKIKALEDKRWYKNWDKPSILIGDGFTDLQIYQAGMVDSFIAYTQHAKRQVVIDSAPYQADNVKDLKTILQDLLF